MHGYTSHGKQNKHEFRRHWTAYAGLSLQVEYPSKSIQGDPHSLPNAALPSPAQVQAAQNAVRNNNTYLFSIQPVHFSAGQARRKRSNERPHDTLISASARHRRRRGGGEGTKRECMRGISFLGSHHRAAAFSSEPQSRLHPRYKRIVGLARLKAGRQVGVRGVVWCGVVILSCN